MTSAADGAHSVFRFIERTAERVPEGARWQTIDYDNQPQYDYGAFNGCGGIGVFLAEYGRQAGSETALDLARAANRWCSTVDIKGYERGLLVGRTGAAMSWLYLAGVTGESVSKHCVHNADVILGEDPGPFTDLMGGAASNGLYLLRLWEATDDGRYLDGARRNGAWLRDQMVAVESSADDPHGDRLRVGVNPPRPGPALWPIAFLQDSTPGRSTANPIERALHSGPGHSVTWTRAAPITRPPA